MRCWIVVVALIGGCRKPAEEPDLSVRVNEPIPTVVNEVAPTAPIEPVAPDASIGSRDVPGERGVPFDRTALGSFAHPFGALEVIKPTSSRDEILVALPSARRDADDDITVSVGVEDLVAMIDIDEVDQLDGVSIKLPYSTTSYDLLAEAWGKPTDYHTWFDRKRGWRADWDDGTIVIGPFVRLADVVGGGPEGLTDPKPVIGATLVELQQRFGKRLVEEPDPSEGMNLPESEKTDETTFRLILPTTEVCRYDTLFVIRVRAGRAVGVTLTQCYDDEPMRRAALAALESRWGRAVPGRSIDDRPVFLFTRAQRRFVMEVAGDWEPAGAWRVEITDRRAQ